METKKIKLGRKFILFLITMVSAILLAFFDKDASQIISLYAVYCAGNVGSKISSNISNKKEEQV